MYYYFLSRPVSYILKKPMFFIVYLPGGFPVPMETLTPPTATAAAAMAAPDDDA